MKTRKARPNISPISTFGADNRLHFLVVSPVGAIQNKRTRKSSPLTKASKPPRDERVEEDSEKTGSRKSPGTCLHVYKNRPRHTLTSCLCQCQKRSCRSPGFGRCSFLPSLILNIHLRYLNMSGACFFAGAHHFVVRDNTFIDVSEMFTKGICQAS